MFRRAHPEENRQGLGADFTIHDPISKPEPAAAPRPIQVHQTLHAGGRANTVGADQAYLRKDLVAACRGRNIAPQVACREGASAPELDGRTTTKGGYRVCQKLRKRVEEIFGWIRTAGGRRRSRYRGIERTPAGGDQVAGTDKGLRMARLSLAGAR